MLYWFYGKDNENRNTIIMQKQKEFTTDNLEQKYKKTYDSTE